MKTSLYSLSRNSYIWTPSCNSLMYLETNMTQDKNSTCINCYREKMNKTESDVATQYVFSHNHVFHKNYMSGKMLLRHFSMTFIKELHGRDSSHKFRDTCIVVFNSTEYRSTNHYHHLESCQSSFILAP
jgi:hypothetical protein